MDAVRESIGNRIAAVVLNYNNYSDTVECVDRLLGASRIDIIIVDNDSPDGSGDRLRERYASESCVRYLQTGENRGYAAGNNFGIRFVLDGMDDCYICILNNDTLPNPGMLYKLADFLDKNPNCGIVGPVILENAPGEVIQSAGADIDLWRGGVGLLHYHEIYTPKDGAAICPYISGACLMIRSDDAGHLGPLPECYFLFFEETEWCLHASRNGFDIQCLWSTRLVHKGSATVSEQGSLSKYLMIRNRALFEKRNANALQLMCYVIHTYAHTLVRLLIKRQDCSWEFSAVRDGLGNRVCDEYSYVQRSSVDQ